MFDVMWELGRVVLHTLIIYVFLIFVMSLLGRRQSSELSLTELVVIMVIGSSVETSMIGGDTSLQAGLVSAATLLAANRALSSLMQRHAWLRHVVVGRPIILVHNGRILNKNIREAGLSPDDVLEGVRERGYDGLADVRLAVLEMDGTISVVAKESSKDESGKE
ncbi:MAG: DUF421 domain-containing protein [Rudaea sp.]